MNIKKTATIITLLLVSSLFVLLSSRDALAQSSIPLVVAPARTQVNLDPGESENFIIKFFNESTTSIAGSINVVDFIVTGKEGKPVLLDNIDYPLSNQYSGASWVKLPYEKASIAAGDVVKVNYKVSVPKTAKPGGRYVAIYFESDGQISNNIQIDQQASSTTSRIVGLLYIRVKGPITESAFVDVFNVPVFMQFGPVPISFEIFNKGDYHITPTGALTLTNWFNKKVDQVIIEDKNIFPDTKRGYEEKLGGTWMFGKYTVDLKTTYGETGKVANASQTVWVVPVLLILAIILTITIIILGIFLVNKRLKAKQVALETKLEKEISEVEALKNKFKDQLPKK
ncbi:hypothetical protein ISR94_02925 [Candidatus Microgenomates bacterium]|nr:hypothetical protein [Candidatus Microgenomates bacterium]